MIIIEFLWDYRMTWGAHLLAVLGLTAISIWEQRGKGA